MNARTLFAHLRLLQKKKKTSKLLPNACQMYIRMFQTNSENGASGGGGVVGASEGWVRVRVNVKEHEVTLWLLKAHIIKCKRFHIYMFDRIMSCTWVPFRFSCHFVVTVVRAYALTRAVTPSNNERTVRHFRIHFFARLFLSCSAGWLAGLTGSFVVLIDFISGVLSGWRVDV